MQSSLVKDVVLLFTHVHNDPMFLFLLRISSELSVSPKLETEIPQTISAGLKRTATHDDI